MLSEVLGSRFWAERIRKSMEKEEERVENMRYVLSPYNFDSLFLFYPLTTSILSSSSIFLMLPSMIEFYTMSLRSLKREAEVPLYHQVEPHIFHVISMR